MSVIQNYYLKDGEGGERPRRPTKPAEAWHVLHRMKDTG